MSQRKILLKHAFSSSKIYRDIFTREGLVLIWNSNSLQTNYFCLIGFGVCQFTRKIWNQSIRKNIEWPTQLYRDVLILQRSKKFKKETNKQTHRTVMKNNFDYKKVFNSHTFTLSHLTWYNRTVRGLAAQNKNKNRV